MMRLKGKVAFITGGGGGIGQATEFHATLGEFVTLRADKIQNDTSNSTLEITSQGTGNVKIGVTEFSSTASTITGTADCSFINFMFILFCIPSPEPMGAPNGIIAQAPTISSLFSISGSTLQYTKTV